MSDYSKSTNFTAKDGLTTGDPNKVIKGSEFDTEFNNISTAVATKYDSTDIASTAQAQAGSSDTVLLTPAKLTDWAQGNGGFIEDIQAMSDPNSDNLLGWDDSAGTVVGYNPTNGITTSGTALILDSAVGGTGLTYSTGVLSVDYATEATMATGTESDAAITPQRLTQKHQVAKIDDVTFNTDTTLNDLSLSIGSGAATSLPVSIGTYLFRLSFRVNCASSGVDMKWSLAKGGGAAVVVSMTHRQYRGSADTVANVGYRQSSLASTFDEVVDIDSATHPDVIVAAEGHIVVSTGGTISIQGAQNSSSGTNVNLTGGIIELVRID